MSIHSIEYTQLRKNLNAQLRSCRDRDIRVKVNLILLAVKLKNVSEASRRRGFSRKFFHKWWSRLAAGNFDISCLRAQSRRPKHSPAKLDRALELRIHALSRKQHGSRMIEGLLKQEGHDVSRNTICHILNHRKPPNKKRKHRLKAHRRRYELVVPGQRLQIDVKYVPEKVGGRQAFVYSAVDECTRWRYAWASIAINEHMTKIFLDRLLARCPFPIHTLQTDNGPEFTFRLLAPDRDHLMDVWCREHRIRHRCIPPGEKELNGKVERAHRIDEQYFYWHAPTTTIERFNEALTVWIREYNTRRLHGGLGFITPAAKLDERFKTLQTPFGSDHQHLEGERLMFIQKHPLMKSKTGRQLLNLETDLQRLNMAS